MEIPPLTLLSQLNYTSTPPWSPKKIIPTHQQLDNDLNISLLQPAYWPIYIFVVANEE
jgi:hypothetical protein